MLRYAKFLTNSTLGITLLEQKYYFMLIKLLTLAFVIDPLKEIGTNRGFVA